MILPLASGHADGRLPGDGTLRTSYPTPTRKSQPRVTTLEVAESPLCQRRLWQSPLPAILPPAQPTLWPHQMPSSPLNPAGLVTAELPHPVLSSGRPLPCPFKKPLYATSSGHPPWGAAAVALSSAWRRRQPSPIFSQHLSQFATSVYVSVASKNKFSRGDGFVFTSAPDTQLKAWPHRVPAEFLLQTEHMGRWVVGWRLNGKMG